MAASGTEERSKILVVDDDPIAVDSLAQLLGLNGYEVRAVRSPEAGLAELHANRFDLVITDFCMPEHSGFWMLQEAATAGRLTCPAIIVSALVSQLPRTRFPMLPKPVDTEALLQMCREQLGTAPQRSSSTG